MKNERIKTPQGDFSSCISTEAVPLRSVIRKRCSENMKQIYRRTRMPRNEFNKVEQLY